MIDKEKSIEYWNSVSKDWKKMVYDTDKPATIFPSSQLRQEIVIREIKENFGFNVKILDIGCADGSLVIELLKEGYRNVKGIDNSPSMIEEANLQLKDNGYVIDNVFEVADIESYQTDEKCDIVISMGLIEYLKDLDSFFSLVYNLLDDNGYAYIESKNKLFNLFSANEHTLKTAKSKYTKELEEIKHLSPKKLDDVMFFAYKAIGLNLDYPKEEKEEEYKKYPFDLPQYSPKELMVHSEGKSFNTKKIIYYHCHPFPPRYRESSPELFDRLGVLMQPLGYTPLGAVICSAYVMVINK